MKALAYKAACQIERLQWGDAETLLKHALELHPGDPDVLDLFSRVLDQAAAIQAATASGLRTTKTWSDFNYVYYRYPSQNDLRQANEYDAQARRFWELARRSLASAADAARGTPRGFYFQAVAAQRQGDLQAARSALETAVRLQPGYVSAWQRLALVDGELGLVDQAYEAQMAAANLTQTTAAPMLKLAWLYVGQTRWPTASRALDRGAAVDPAAPRIAAYRGAIARQKGEDAEAAGWFLAAAAVDEAQHLLRGVRLRETVGPPLTPEDVGLQLALNNYAGELLLKAHAAERAVQLLDSNLAMYERVAEADRYSRLAVAMLPQANDEAVLVPEAPNIETLLAWSRVWRGAGLLATQRFDDAVRDWQWVAAFESRKPAVLDVGSQIRVPQAWAVALLGKAFFAKGDYATARRYLSGGVGQNLPPALRAEVQQMSRQLETVRMQQQQSEVQQWQNASRLPPQEQQRRALAYQKQELLRRKQILQQMLDNPSLPDQQKQWVRQSMRQVDETLARMDRGTPEVGNVPNTDPRAGGRPLR